jgi:hypothetical protein
VFVGGCLAFPPLLKAVDASQGWQNVGKAKRIQAKIRAYFWLTKNHHAIVDWLLIQFSGHEKVVRNGQMSFIEIVHYMVKSMAYSPCFTYLEG